MLANRIFCGIFLGSSRETLGNFAGNPREFSRWEIPGAGRPGTSRAISSQFSREVPEKLMGISRGIPGNFPDGKSRGGDFPGQSRGFPGNSTGISPKIQDEFPGIFLGLPVIFRGNSPKCPGNCPGQSREFPKNSRGNPGKFLGDSPGYVRESPGGDPSILG